MSHCLGDFFCPPFLIFSPLFPRRKHTNHSTSATEGYPLLGLSQIGSHFVLNKKNGGIFSQQHIFTQQLQTDRQTEKKKDMAEVAPAPAAAAPAKAPKKKAAARPKKVGPSVGELIVKAVSASKERSGVSLAALKKALAAGGYDVEKNNSRVKIAVKSLVTKGTLVQTKGTGASGSFKINKAAEKKAKKPAKKAAAPKAKKAVAKKPAAAKKPKKAVAKKAVAAKKSPKKAAKPKAAKKAPAKSPKKAKKPAAPKKAAKSPKKAAKPKAAKPKAAKAKKAAPKKK